MRETLDRMAGGVPHQGIIAVVSEKPVLSLESLLETARDPALVVVLDGVEDPRNLGAILRTAEAAGADGVLLPERHSAGLSETVGRASAGALEHVQVARVGNLVQALEALKARGVWVVGFDAAGTERWDAVDLGRPVALVLGGEGRGIRRLVREHCDHLVSLPLFGHVGSLNVSVAAGIALYEVVRQRGAVPSDVRPIPARPAAAAADRRPGARRRRGRSRRPADAAAGVRTSPAADRRRADGAGDARRPARRRGLGPGPTVLKPVGFDPGAAARRSAGQGPPAAATRARLPPPAVRAGRRPAAAGASTGPARRRRGRAIPGRAARGASAPRAPRRAEARGRRAARPGPAAPGRRALGPASDRRAKAGPLGSGEGERPGGGGRRRRRRGRREA